MSGSFHLFPNPAHVGLDFADIGLDVWDVGGIFLDAVGVLYHIRLGWSRLDEIYDGGNANLIEVWSKFLTCNFVSERMVIDRFLEDYEVDFATRENWKQFNNADRYNKANQAERDILREELDIQLENTLSDEYVKLQRDYSENFDGILDKSHYMNSVKR